MPATSPQCINDLCRLCQSPKTCQHHCHKPEPEPDLFAVPDLPERPYTQDDAPSSGYAAGVDTSKAAEPIRAESQKQVLAYVGQQRDIGATVKEVRDTTGLHHGVASGALSVLHTKGHLVRLLQKRGGCRIYVAPQYVNGRPQG